ncbi:right-handed parallel beta-helix repeat-containing protein [Kordia sp.]|uniref:right-handed parallel beta-helix repeat-containing protein n=1 Tax=Kordia sp. TaxID=1965332 RepID=UPI0025B99630|nr:right-handed parallel beta-helix repeat-containing protein [Kordia sp.]MCH2195598.1 glycoside hydrolase family 55 protein [Kordia sp.]
MLIDITSSPFNASADGSHDDTKALEAAFAEIQRIGGGTIIFPEDAFVCISKSISLPSNVKITAHSGKARIKYYNAQNTETKHLFTGNSVANINISNIVFDTRHQSPSVAAILITGYKEKAIENSNITIENCDFKGINTKGACAVRIQKTNGLTIKNCCFKDSCIGIGIWKRNSGISLLDNTFSNTITNTAIRIIGNTDTSKEEYSSDVSIQRNVVKVPAKKSVIGKDGKAKGRPDSSSAIYLTCGDKDYTGNSNFHLNVNISHNHVEGPRLGFFNGGSADLISVKDVKHFQCRHNVSCGSGDLGFAFERCHEGEISHNRAEENNSCGIAVWGSSYLTLVHNKCGSNEQTRDGIYRNHPYGGIRIEYASHNITLENNEFYHLASEAKLTQQYGIVIKHTNIKGVKLYPSAVKVANNMSSDQIHGAIFNEVDDTEIL